MRACMAELSRATSWFDVAAFDDPCARAVRVDHRYSSGAHHRFGNEGADDAIHHLLQFGHDIGVLVVEQLLLHARYGDLNRWVQCRHCRDLLRQPLRSVRDGGIHVAFESSPSLKVSDDHRHRGVVTHHAQVEGEVDVRRCSRVAAWLRPAVALSCALHRAIDRRVSRCSSPTLHGSVPLLPTTAPCAVLRNAHDPRCGCCTTSDAPTISMATTAKTNFQRCLREYRSMRRGEVRGWRGISTGNGRECTEMKRLQCTCSWNDEVVDSCDEVKKCATLSPPHQRIKRGSHFVPAQNCRSSPSIHGPL